MIHCGCGGSGRHSAANPDRVALPEAGGVAIVEARVTGVIGLVNGVSAARQAIAVGEDDRPVEVESEIQ